MPALYSRTRPKRAVKWHEVYGEDEVGERNCKCFELVMFRQHRLVLSSTVLPPGFAGGSIELQLAHATSGSKAGLGGADAKHLIDFKRLRSGPICSNEEGEARAFDAATPTVTLRVDASGESEPFGVVIASYSHARQPPKKYWLTLRWADGPACGAEALGPFRFYFLSRTKASAPARRPPPPDASPDPSPGPPVSLHLAEELAACLAEHLPVPGYRSPQGAPAAPLGKRPPSGSDQPRKRSLRRSSEDALPLPSPAPSSPEEQAAGLDEQFSRLALAAREVEAAPAAGAEARPAPCTDDFAQFYSANLRRYEDRIRQIILRVSEPRIQQRDTAVPSNEYPGLACSLQSLVDLHWRVPMAQADTDSVPAGGGSFPCVLTLPAVAAVEAPLRKLHAAACAASDPEPADRLCSALADVRVLATSIVQDEMGGVEFKDMLQAVRAARRSDAGPQFVVSALLRAILDCAPSSLSRGELAVGVQQSIAFLECCGSVILSYSAVDQSLMDPPAMDALARRLLECADLLGDSELKARAVAACANSGAFVRSPDDDSFVDTLLEAWGLLKRHGLVPSRAEVEVLRTLSHLLSKLGVHSPLMKQRYCDLHAHVILQLYWYAGDRPRDFLVQNLLRHLIAIDARGRGLHSSDRQYETILGLMNEAAYTRPVRVNFPNNLIRVEQTVHSVRSLNIVKALQYFREMIEDERTHRLFHFHSSDWINRLRFLWPGMQPPTLVRLLRVLEAVLKMTGCWNETPSSAHLLFALGDVHAAAGDPAEAAAAYEECLEMYGRFDDFFPPDCRRVVAARSSLAACRAALAACGPAR